VDDYLDHRPGFELVLKCVSPNKIEEEQGLNFNASISVINLIYCIKPLANDRVTEDFETK